MFVLFRVFFVYFCVFLCCCCFFFLFFLSCIFIVFQYKNCSIRLKKKNKKQNKKTTTYFPYFRARARVVSRMNGTDIRMFINAGLDASGLQSKLLITSLSE